MLNILKQKISNHLNHLFHDGDVDVTIYPTYGIRDVVNDEMVNDFRLKGVDSLIKAEKIVCATDEHHKLAVIIQREHQQPYAKNSPAGEEGWFTPAFAISSRRI